MAFLRYGRDKRGYESVSLVQPVGGRKGKLRTRILYWYRTPPNVRVGRDPFDADTRKAIEAQNPGVSFDWSTLLETPKPPDVEKWRERRRLMKAQRAAAGFDEEPGAETATVEQVASEEPPDLPLDEGPVLFDPPAVSPDAEPVLLDPPASEIDASTTASDPSTMAIDQPERRRRRRRGGRRHRRRGAAADQSPEASTPAEPSTGDAPHVLEQAPLDHRIDDQPAHDEDADGQETEAGGSGGEDGDGDA